MRLVKDCEPEKRGCKFCADVKRRKIYDEIIRKEVSRNFCPYDECPYHELDNVESYSDYDKRMRKLLKGILRLD